MGVVGKIRICHSDRGSVYRARTYEEMPAEGGIEQSCSRPSSPQENPHVERLMRTLKEEMGMKKRYAGLAEAREEAAEAIREYNRERGHTALGYEAPWEKLESMRPSL